MTYPLMESWSPWHDVVFLLALSIAVMAFIAFVQLVRMTLESRRRERQRWQAWLAANRQELWPSSRWWDGR